MERHGTTARSESLFRRLYRQAAMRWAGLAVAVVLLSLLWMFAGRVRAPGAAKRSWAVMASRALAVAGAFLTARLLLVPGEERIPVLFLPSTGDPGDIGRYLALAAALRRKGYEDIPILDVVRFIREGRYVPRKSFSVVVQVDSLELLGPALADREGLKLTVIMPPGAFGPEAGEMIGALPEDVTLGTIAGTGREAAGELRRLADRSEEILSKRCEYAVPAAATGAGLRELLRASGYVSLLGGEGYNRSGDESHLVGLIDVSAIVRARRGVRVLGLWIALYRGGYGVWPALAIGGGFGALEA
jgi:hypothetical protein